MIDRALSNAQGAFVLNAELGVLQLERSELPPGFVDELRPRNLQERETVRIIKRLECGVVQFWTKQGW